MYHYYPLLIIFNVIAGFFAKRKGYRFWLWFFAMSLLGLVLLAFLPDLNLPEIPPEKKEKLRKDGNTDAIILLVLGTLPLFCCFIDSVSNTIKRSH